MPLALHSQHKMVQLPAWTAIVDFDLNQIRQDFFPPAGFLYCNMFALAAPERSSAARTQTLSSQWRLGTRTAFVQSCEIVVGGILTKGAASIESIGSGRWAVLVLHPVLAYHFLQERLNLVNDAFAPLRDLLRKEGDLFKSQLEDGCIHSWENEPVLQFVLNRIGEPKLWKDDPIFHAVNRIIAKKGLIRVKELAAQVFMSERNLERHFIEKVGVSPKAYASIWRFQNALQLLQSRGIEKLGDLVQQAGYYDISHFMKDLKQKTGDVFEHFLRGTPELLETHGKVLEAK